MEKAQAQALEIFSTLTPRTAYVGKAQCCRCGCKGTYADIDDLDGKIHSRIKRGKKLVESGAEFEIIDSHSEVIIDIVTGEDRALCIYFKKP